MKCGRCRADKKRCVPCSDQFPDGRDKCLRCERLGHPCGPIEKKIRRPARQKPQADQIMEDWDFVASDTSPSSDHSPVSNSVISTVPGLPYSDIYTTDSPAVSSEHCSLSHQPTTCTARDELCMSKSIVATHNPGLSFLARLGDLHATREVLNRDVRFCDSMRLLSPEPFLQQNVAAALRASVRGVEADFEHELREARIELEREDDDGYFYGFLLSELLRISYQFTNTPSASSVGFVGQANGNIDQWHLQKMLSRSRQARGALSAADFLCNKLKHSMAMNNACVTQNPLDPTAYKDASRVVARVLENIVVDDLEHNLLVSSWAYPPCHLAYMCGDEQAALDLWKGGRQNAQIDILERSLVHLVVYASDVKMLRRLLRCNSRTALRMDFDLFRLTPLQITACRDDLPCFSLIWQHYTNAALKTKYGNSALSLAAKHGSAKVVGVLLSSNCQSLELSEALRNAIDAGQEHIANIMITHLADSSPLDSLLLHKLRYEAESQGLWNVAKKLEVFGSPWSSVSGVNESATPYPMGIRQNEKPWMWTCQGIDKIQCPSATQETSTSSSPLIIHPKIETVPMYHRLEPFKHDYVEHDWPKENDLTQVVQIS